MARYLRLNQIIGNRSLGIPPKIPVSRTTIYQWVKDGTFPPPARHFSKRIVVWLESDVDSFTDGTWKPKEQAEQTAA